MKKKILVVFCIIVFVFICGKRTEFDWGYLCAGIIYSGENTGEIIFSKANGFYEEDFYLKIYAPSEEVYYTLDGSEPTKSSLKYEAPILIEDATNNENVYCMREDFSTGFIADEDKYQVPDYLIDKCTIIKAAYYNEEGTRSDIEERVYFVDFEEKTGYENVNIISITSEPENLFGAEEGIYVLGETFKKYQAAGIDEEEGWYFWSANYRNGGRAWEREAYINVFNESKENVLSQKVGIRIQGGVSRGFYPKSLNIYARDEYGDNRMRYDFWKTGYYPKRMTLSSGGNDDRGKMLDRLGAELTRECTFSTMNYEPYILFLNGEYWGFYYLTEKYDEQYMEHYYDVEPENVIMVKKKSIEVGKETDIELYYQMCDFIENADMTVEENYRYACELLDIQSFIDYFAAEIYMARQKDWPNSNYALWRVREKGNKEYEDGKWRWMLFDVNTSAMHKNSIEHDTIAYARERNGLFRSLWNNSEFRDAFAKRILEMAETIFREDVVVQKVCEYEDLMFEPVKKHHQRFFGETFEEKYPTANTIKTFAMQRAEFIPIMLEANMLD